MQELKVCPKCHFELPITDFAIHDKKRGYRRGHCDACERTRMRKYYAEHPEYREQVRLRAAERYKNGPQSPAYQRKHMLKKRYGLSPEQYDALLLSQVGKCALCGGADPGRSGHDKKWRSGHWNVDHCHTNGHVRWLLCHTCNTRLGSYEALMKEIGETAVLDYLTRPSPVPSIALVVAVTPRYVETLPPKFVGKPCSVEGCGNDTTARGFCQKHYARFLRTGEVGGAEHLPHNGPRGAAHHKSNLTDEIVREIRASSETGVALAAKFGVTTACISNVRLRKVWKDVN